MAQYRGVVSGGRGSASRLGDKKSGMLVECNGWDLGATCHIKFNVIKQRDELSISVTTGSGIDSGSVFLGTFIINSKGKITKIRAPK